MVGPPFARPFILAIRALVSSLTYAGSYEFSDPAGKDSKLFDGQGLGVYDLLHLVKPYKSMDIYLGGYFVIVIMLGRPLSRACAHPIIRLTVLGL